MFDKLRGAIDNRPVIGRTAVGEAPTTPIRIIMGIVLAAAFVVVHLVLIVIDAAVSLEVSLMLGGFILVQEGIDVGQWIAKRRTDIDYQLAKAGSAPRVTVTAEHAAVRAEHATVAPPAAPPAAPPVVELVAVDEPLNQPPPGADAREPERGP